MKITAATGKNYLMQDFGKSVGYIRQLKALVELMSNRSYQ